MNCYNKYTYVACNEGTNNMPLMRNENIDLGGWSRKTDKINSWKET